MIAKQNILKDYVIEPPSGKWWHYLAYAALLFVVIYISNIEVAFASVNTGNGAAAWVTMSESNDEGFNSVNNVTKPVEEATPSVATPEPSFNNQVFTISAYYSPVQGQNRYVTGSYAGDIRLNGGGVNGADGTPVYPGMIAAPSTFAFGTKMHIPGIGTVAVHDRGGAIKGSRLDVWMGYGDKGLERAMKWGKRTLEVKVYGINPDVVEQIELDGYSESEKHYTAQESGGGNVSEVTAQVQPVPSSRLFSGQLKIGSSGQDVAKLQQILKDLKYYEGEITSVFDTATHEAVARFQISKNVVPSQNSYGAGYVGPVTSSLLASAAGGIETAHAMSSEITYDGIFSTDLKPGDSGENVIELQVELQKVNLFGIEPTGYYGELTEHAIYKFQQIHMLAGDKTATGAGIFGPMTRSKMNEIVAARLKIEEMITENP